MNEEKTPMSCIDCHVLHCRYPDRGEAPEFCLTKNIPEETQQRAMDYLMSPEDNRIAVAAAEVEYEGYCKRTRVEEVMEFAKKIGAKKLGIATCMGLIDEARILAKILRANGFEVYGVICKVGSNKKSSIGIPVECEEIGPYMCNPVLQAEALNDAKTDLNLINGLCVGHDSLFIKHSNALVTSVVTKDRVLGHNPCVALYQADKYFKKKFFPEENK